MLVYSVDLGTTNIKVALFDEQLNRLSVQEAPAVYNRFGACVEFDAEAYFDLAITLIQRCSSASPVATGEHDVVLAFTGQAESIVLTASDGRSIRPAISWLDERAVKECSEIESQFPASEAFRVTGQPRVSPVWPAAKVRWLYKHERETLMSASRVLMLKDYVQARLTGLMLGEISIRGFSYFFDVLNKSYWKDMLDFIGIELEQLPDIVAAGSIIESVRPTIIDQLPPAKSYRVCVGALDHFCSMLGTGAYRPHVINESAGTVLSVSMLTNGWSFDERRAISFHRGIFDDDIVLFSCVDSGGISLDWFRHGISRETSYEELDAKLRSRTFENAPLFLPYLTGVNAPDFFSGARAAFLELTLAHDYVDFAYAVEEGVAHILRRNIEHCAKSDEPANRIISSGGGAKSSYWCQLKADVCGIPVYVPSEREAACRGAAILALAATGGIDGFDSSSPPNAPTLDVYWPSAASGLRESRYRRFTESIDALFRRAS